WRRPSSPSTSSCSWSGRCAPRAAWCCSRSARSRSANARCGSRRRAALSIDCHAARDYKRTNLHRRDGVSSQRGWWWRLGVVENDATGTWRPGDTRARPVGAEATELNVLLELLARALGLERAALLVE